MSVCAMPPTIYTIGFAQKNAECFFNLLRDNHVCRVIDVRLNNLSQLAGFTKKDDLKFFLKELCQCDYEHRLQWAPTKDLLDCYKKKHISWNDYEVEFFKIVQRRNAMQFVDILSITNNCLLCSESKPDKCHRRLLAEYLKAMFPSLKIVHL